MQTEPPLIEPADNNMKRSGSDSTSCNCPTTKSLKVRSQEKTSLGSDNSVTLPPVVSQRALDADDPSACTRSVSHDTGVAATTSPCPGHSVAAESAADSVSHYCSGGHVADEPVPDTASDHSGGSVMGDVVTAPGYGTSHVVGDSFIASPAASNHRYRDRVGESGLDHSLSDNKRTFVDGLVANSLTNSNTESSMDCERVAISPSGHDTGSPVDLEFSGNSAPSLDAGRGVDCRLDDSTPATDKRSDSDVGCDLAAVSTSHRNTDSVMDCDLAAYSPTHHSAARSVGDESVGDAVSSHRTGRGVDEQLTVTHPSALLHINDMPASILIQILHNLALRDLLKRASLVCKHWNKLCFDPDLWREINFRGHLKVNNTVLERFTRYNISLTFLDLTDVRMVTSDGLKNTLSHCTNLRKLYLVRCMHLTDTALQAIGDHCRNMVEVKLDCCSALSDQSLKKLAAGCPKLEKLWLNQCSGIRDEGVLAVARGCPRLKLLTAEQCREISDAVLQALAQGCPDLQSLGFMSNNFTPSGVRHLGKCKKLRVLELTQMCAINDDCIMDVIKNCPYLRTLNVSLCTGITDKSVCYIAEHGVSIQSLYLVACKVTDQALFSLAKHCSTLEKLDVGWCEEITDKGAEKVSEGCKNLTDLGLMRCDKVTKETSERLVKTFPDVTFSTMWLECERLLARARLAGYIIA